MHLVLWVIITGLMNIWIWSCGIYMVPHIRYTRGEYVPHLCPVSLCVNTLIRHVSLSCNNLDGVKNFVFIEKIKSVRANVTKYLV